MRIAISGHRGLTTETELLVDTEIRGRLSAYSASDLVGISYLADGADQVFAAAVLDAGGKLEVVVPAKQFRESLPQASWQTYDALLARADDVHELEHTTLTDEALKEAGTALLEQADRLYAVWDGKSPRGKLGPADVVKLAKDREIGVSVIWPEGAKHS